MIIKTFPLLPSDPLLFWKKLHSRPRQGFFLGSMSESTHDHVCYLSLGEPRDILNRSADDLSDPLITVEEKLEETRSHLAYPRFVGVLNFEMGRRFDRGMGRLHTQPNPLGKTDFLMGDYPAVVKLDLLKKRTTVVTHQNSDVLRVESLLKEVHTGRENKFKPSSYPNKTQFRFLRYKQFSQLVRKAKQAIAAGDIYQANLSFRFESPFKKNPIDLYRWLCKSNPSPYACLIKQGSRWIVSCSPELLLEVKGNTVITRPIAGTRPRGDSTTKDRLRKAQLLLSPKERAEHIMLVDLERNDLGRVAKPGSIRVTARYQIEQYSHVMHIVSEVKGTLPTRTPAIDALKAVFPGGTITGCPKIKSIEVIENLERQARGPFYGSAGFICWNGDLKFNLLIRTALVQNKRVFVQAGAGIVADSHPRREYNEVHAKARVLLDAVKKL